MSQQPGTSAGRGYELLRTKLAPPRLQTVLVPRAPLLARLAAVVDHKLTLLSAPAGYGKTTLISQWFYALGMSVQESGARSGYPIHNPQVAWLSLDGNDNDPVRFWRYVIAACQQFAPGIGMAAVQWLHTASRPSWEHVLTRLINDLIEYTGEGDGANNARSAHAVLVLEDYHLITAAQVHETLTFLLDHLPVSFHLIIATRHDPPLPLAQMRARNELSELRAVDLRFSHVETQAFFQQSLPLPLAPAAITYLADRTEGWVAGLRLATLALQNRPQPEAMGLFLATFRGSHAHIFTYLVAEVLRAQPPSRQQFLLKTCVLSRLNGALCDAIMGRNDSEQLLEQLEQANLFLVPLADSQAQGATTWYRYHALFAEAMQQAALRQLGEAELRTLAQKASLWYEHHGLLTEAIETALTAQDFSRTATLIERTMDPLNPNIEHHTLRRWLGGLPEAILREHPTLAFFYAVAILFTSERRAPATLALLQMPLQIAEEHWSAPQGEHKLGPVLAFRALLAWLQGEQGAAFANAKQALARLPEDEMQWRGICLIFVGVEELQTGHLYAAGQTLTAARALCEVTGNEYGALDAGLLLGEVFVWQGELRQAAQLYQVVLDAAANAQMERDQALIRVGNARLGLSALAYEWNDLETAQQQASQAQAIGEQVAYVDLQLRAAILLARLEHRRGETAAAQQRLHALIAQTTQPRWSVLLRRMRSEQARLALDAGDLVAVEQWSATMAHQGDDNEISRWQQEQDALILARWWIALGETESALNLLERWQAEARVKGWARATLKIRILQTLAYNAANQLPQARQALLDALRLGQPQGYQQLFLDEGERLTRLLPGVLPGISDEPLLTYTQGLLAASGSGEGKRKENKPVAPSRAQDLTRQLIEPLSKREQDVLRLVAAGLATEEVGRELIISVGTVRTHLKHIYGKLDAHSRVQAVERAWVLKLF